MLLPSGTEHKASKDGGKDGGEAEATNVLQCRNSTQYIALALTPHRQRPDRLR
jgi:hypothetical protein